MPHGGKRSGAGRQRGAPNIATAARQAKVAATGETPLDYMLRVMRDEAVEAPRRDDMAKASAHYVHPKLAAIEHTGRDGKPIETIAIPPDPVEASKAYQRLIEGK